MRNYNGSLVVDHTARAITLSVETHKGNLNIENENENGDDVQIQSQHNKRLASKSQRTNKRVVQDLKGNFNF